MRASDRTTVAAAVCAALLVAAALLSAPQPAAAALSAPAALQQLRRWAEAHMPRIADPFHHNLFHLPSRAGAQVQKTQQQQQEQQQQAAAATSGGVGAAAAAQYHHYADPLLEWLSPRSALAHPFFAHLAPYFIGDDAFAGAADTAADALWRPRVDVANAKDGKSVVIHAELPGVRADDVVVSVHDGVLTLRGTRERHTHSALEPYHYEERTFGTFERSWSVPRELRAEQLRASFANGVLEIVVPNLSALEPAKPEAHRVPITVMEVSDASSEESAKV